MHPDFKISIMQALLLEMSSPAEVRNGIEGKYTASEDIC